LYFGGHGGEFTFSRGQSFLLFREEDRVTIGGEHDISKDIIEIEGRGCSTLSDGLLSAAAIIAHNEHGAARHGKMTFFGLLLLFELVE
jgi:hypothetical protein